MSLSYGLAIHNLDWLLSINTGESETIDEVEQKIISGFENEMTQFLNHLDKNNKPVSVIVAGFVNFDAFFEGKCQERKEAEPESYPYFDANNIFKA